MTLRQKILLLGTMALAGMCLVLGLHFGSYATQSRAIEMMARNAQAVGALSNAVHELQKERGQSAIRDSAALAEQVVLTDAAFSRVAGTGVDITGFIGSLFRLRAMAATGEEGGITVRDGYNGLLRNLVDEMDRLTHEPETATAKAEISAHIHLVAAKEYLAQVRATLAYWIEYRSDDPAVLNNLMRLRSLYDEEVRRFGLKASPELTEAFAAGRMVHEVAQTLAVLERVTTTNRLPQTLDLGAWWSMATGAIDHLKGVEDQSLGLIERKAKAELAALQSGMHFEVVALSAVGLAVLFLALSATTSLLRALNRTMTGMEQIAESRDFHSRIPDDSPDEIGRISHSFNRLLDIAEHLLKEKDHLAATDPLTGVNNRLRFTQILRDEARRKRRTGTPMALVMLDIDDFKRINDTYGHNAGDEVLKTFALLIGKGIRSTDFVARWGGEEFVMLLRDDDCDTAMIVAEKLRRQVAETEFPGIGKMTCSVGVTAWASNDTEAGFVARADAALYRSKNTGRNRVSCD